MPNDESQPRKGIFETPLTRRQIVGGAAAFAGVAALGPLASACGSSSSSGSSASPAASGSAAGGGPKKGGDLVAGIYTGSAKDSYDPHRLAYEPEIVAGYQLYDGLMTFTPDYKVTNALAEELTPSADAMTWTVKIKPDVVFSDGSPVNADAVVWSVKRILDPKFPGNSAETFVGLTQSGVQKIDDKTVQFNLDTPNAVFYEALASRESNIVPSTWTLKNPIGSGPFTLKSWTAGQQSEFTPNPNYWGDGPYVDSLTVIEYAEPTARLNALLSGEIDWAGYMDGTQLKTIQATPGYAAWQTKNGGYFPFTMRIDVAPFSDVKVRQAFRLIVDREQMITQAYDSLGWAGNDMYAIYDPGYPSSLPQRTQDLEQAKSLLKQAGQEGLTVELVCSDGVGAGTVNAAAVLAQQAKGAGANVKVRKVDSSVMYGDEYCKWPFAMDYWGTRNYLPQTSMGTTKSAPYNETHWPGTYTDWLKLVNEAWKTTDDAKRNELVTQASTIEYNNGGLIVWSYNVSADGYKDTIGGMVHDVFGGSSIGYRYHLLYYK
jgi:peptide/nickel transport system substrate-binding protein